MARKRFGPGPPASHRGRDVGLCAHSPPYADLWLSDSTLTSSEAREVRA